MLDVEILIQSPAALCSLTSGRRSPRETRSSCSHSKLHALLLPLLRSARRLLPFRKSGVPSVDCRIARAPSAVHNAGWVPLAIQRSLPPSRGRPMHTSEAASRGTTESTAPPSRPLANVPVDDRREEWSVADSSLPAICKGRSRTSGKLTPAPLPRPAHPIGFAA